MLDVLKIREDFPMLKKTMHGKLEMHIVEIMTYHMK